MRLSGSILWVGLAILGLGGVGSSQGQATAVELEEMRRLAGQVEDLREANAASMRKIAQLQSQVESLRSDLRQANERQTTKLADFASREDLRELAKKMQEVDQKREADKHLILEELKKLGQTLATPAPAPATPKPRNRPPVEIPDKPQEAKELTGYPHVVQSGESLSQIVAAYNAAFKEKGKKTITLEMVKRANPKININNIYVGQEILIPEPGEKKQP